MLLLIVLIIFLFLLTAYSAATAYYINDFYLAITSQDPTIDLMIYDRQMFYVYVFSVIASILCAGFAVFLIAFLAMASRKKDKMENKKSELSDFYKMGYPPEMLGGLSDKMPLPPFDASSSVTME